MIFFYFLNLYSNILKVKSDVEIFFTRGKLKKIKNEKKCQISVT